MRHTKQDSTQTAHVTAPTERPNKNAPAIRRLTAVLRPGDCILYLLLLVLLCLTPLVQALVFRTPKDTAVVTVVTPEQNLQYPLSGDQTITITANGYTLQIIIADEKVRVCDADCPDRVCVHTGNISRSGESIVCLPAECVISIAGTNRWEVDGVAG